MAYVVTFTWKDKRYSSADHFKTKENARWLKDALIGHNPRIVQVEDMQACPVGFKKERTGRCVK